MLNYNPQTLHAATPASKRCLPARHCERYTRGNKKGGSHYTDLHFLFVFSTIASGAIRLQAHRSRSLRLYGPTTPNCESVGSGFSWKCSVTPQGLCLTLADPANPKDTESASRKRNFVLPQGLILCRLSTHKEERSTGALHSRAHYERSNGFFYNPLPTARQQRQHRRRTARDHHRQNRGSQHNTTTPQRRTTSLGFFRELLLYISWRSQSPRPRVKSAAISIERGIGGRHHRTAIRGSDALLRERSPSAFQGSDFYYSAHLSQALLRARQRASTPVANGAATTATTPPHRPCYHT